LFVKPRLKDAGLYLEKIHSWDNSINLKEIKQVKHPMDVS
jgi:hypothetical protein